MNNQLSSLTTVQLRRAADIKEKIEGLDNELVSILGTSAPVSGKLPAKKRGMSAAGRAKIAAAQRARWAKAKATKPAKASVKSPAKQKVMSAAARAKIAKAAKARWAKAKAAGKNTL